MYSETKNINPNIMAPENNDRTIGKAELKALGIHEIQLVNNDEMHKPIMADIGRLRAEASKKAGRFLDR